MYTILTKMQDFQNITDLFEGVAIFQKVLVRFWVIIYKRVWVFFIYFLGVSVCLPNVFSLAIWTR